MNPHKGYRENVAEQERRMIELEHKLEVVTRQREELAEALPDPKKLRLLADWIDMRTALDALDDGVEVQLDIRRWARLAEQALATKEGGV